MNDDTSKLLKACVEYRAMVDKLEREKTALRNEIARLSNQTNWVCSCGGTDCAGQKENAALRELLNEPYQFFRFGHKALMPWGKALDDWCGRAEKLGIGKEAQP